MKWSWSHTFFLSCETGCDITALEQLIIFHLSVSKVLGISDSAWNVLNILYIYLFDDLDILQPTMSNCRVESIQKQATKVAPEDHSDETDAHPRKGIWGCTTHG